MYFYSFHIGKVPDTWILWEQSSGEAALLGDTPVRDDPAVDVVIKVPSLEIPGRWQMAQDLCETSQV